MQENVKFVGFKRFETHVAARFLADDFEQREFLLDRASAELRRKNLEADGVACPETRAALDAWPKP